MDRSTRRRLLLGFASNWFSKLAGTIITLVQAPIFFHFWATNVYGDWLIVNAIPSYLAFSSIGFGNVASNEMTMLNSGGDREGALRVFQSCWWLIALICAAVGALLAPVLYLVPVSTLLNIHAISWVRHQVDHPLPGAFRPVGPTRAVDERSLHLRQALPVRHLRQDHDHVRRLRSDDGSGRSGLWSIALPRWCSQWPTELAPSHSACSCARIFRGWSSGGSMCASARYGV